MAAPVRPTAEYIVRVRNGSTLQLVGELSSYRRALFVRRHNAVGSWALEMPATDPVAAQLVTDKAGIQVTRLLRDPATGKQLSSSILFSGPRWGRVRQMKDNILIASGFDDNIWLQGRTAYPVTNYPYAGLVEALPGIKRYFRLGESSGTPVHDLSGNGQNGTYSGSGLTYSQAPYIDDVNTAVLFDGVSGSLTFPTTGLPTGNSPWTQGVWFNVSAFPVPSNAILISYGNRVAGQNPLVYLTPAGNIVSGGWSWGDISAAVTTGAWHFIVGTWDGTTMSAYLDGVLLGTTTPPAMAIPSTGTTGMIGADTVGTVDFFHGTLDEPFICAGALPSATIANLYAVGVSRFSAAAYDTQTGAAEDVIRHYVDLNAISAVNDPSGQSRAVPFLSASASSSRGSTVTGNARFDQLVSADSTGLLQQLAQSGGMGFKVAQSGTSLIFSQFVPTDRTASVLFSAALGNLADFSYEEDGPDFTQGGNSVMVGGGGQGIARTFIVRRNDASLGAWGRFEGFIDARDTSDLTTLDQRGDAALAQIGASTKSSLTLAPQVGQVFGQDFDLGDKVTVVLEDGSDYSGPVFPLVLSGMYNAPSATLPTATTTEVNNLANTNVNSPVDTLLGTATGWGELWGLGSGSTGNTGSWAGLSNMGAPTGHGMILDSTLLEGMRLAAGHYQADVKINVSVGSVIGDIYANFYKRSAAGVYTLLASSVLPGANIPSGFPTTANFILNPADAFASAVFAVGDKLYCDLWIHVTTNSTGSGTATISWRALANAGQPGGDASTNQFDAWFTPGYQYFQPKPAPTVFQDLIREVDIELSADKAELITPIVGTPGAEVIGSAFGALAQAKQVAQLRTTVSRLARSS